MNWLDPANGLFKAWAEQQKSLFQSWAEGKVATQATPPIGGIVGPFDDAMKQYAELAQRTMEGWTTLMQQGVAAIPGNAVDPTSLQKLFDPAAWNRAGAGRFDLALERLTEGPTYATLWDLDRKLLNAQKLWMQRSQATLAYQGIVQSAWRRAMQRFVEALGAPGVPLTRGRELLDLWIATANQSLVEMHRSPEFLEAQRTMTRAATDYRLQEREIAESFCAAHHVPTRTEMDEVQRAVYELRRELRSLAKSPRPPLETAGKTRRTRATSGAATKRKRAAAS